PQEFATPLHGLDPQPRYPGRQIITTEYMAAHRPRVLHCHRFDDVADDVFGDPTPHHLDLGKFWHAVLPLRAVERLPGSAGGLLFGFLLRSADALAVGLTTDHGGRCELFVVIGTG